MAHRARAWLRGGGSCAEEGHLQARGRRGSSHRHPRSWRHSSHLHPRGGGDSTHLHPWSRRDSSHLHPRSRRGTSRAGAAPASLRARGWYRRVSSRAVAMVIHWRDGRHLPGTISVDLGALLLLKGVGRVMTLGHVTIGLGLLCGGIVRRLRVGLEGLSEGLRFGLLQHTVRRARGVALGEGARRSVYGPEVFRQDLDEVGGEDADSLVPPQPASPPGPISRVEAFYQVALDEAEIALGLESREASALYTHSCPETAGCLLRTSPPHE